MTSEKVCGADIWIHLHLGFWTRLHLETKVSGNKILRGSDCALRKLHMLWKTKTVCLMEFLCGEQSCSHSSQAEYMKISKPVFVNKMELVLPTI